MCRRDEEASVRPIRQRGGCAMPEMGGPPNPAGATACPRLRYIPVRAKAGVSMIPVKGQVGSIGVPFDGSCSDKPVL